MKLELEEHPRPEDFRIVLDGVRSFNRAQTGNERPRPVAYYLRDDDGEIVGGVQGNLWGRSTHIDALWVSDNYRGRGFGSQLMKAIEEYAAAHGYPLIYLETASFQALPFYQSLGLRNVRRVGRNQRRAHIIFSAKGIVFMILISTLVGSR